MLNSHGGSLTDESLQIVPVVNSRVLTTEIINDVTSLISLGPINLTMKSKIVMPLPGVLASPDKYCRKH